MIQWTLVNVLGDQNMFVCTTLMDQLVPFPIFYCNAIYSWTR
jgi:hypothetical protein